MTQAKQVFISYDSADTRFAHRLAEDLQRIGVEVWIAPDSIRPGEGWVDAINRGLTESSHMVTVLTPSAIESKWVTQETNAAIALERSGQLRVIPLDVEPCDPPPLWTSYQMIPFRDDYEKGLNQLATNLKDAPVPKESAPVPKESAPPPELQPPSMKQILERARGIISEQMGVDKATIHAETNLILDLNADDMDMQELLFEFEDEFDVSIPEGQGYKLPTVRDWAAYIMQCLQG